MTDETKVEAGERLVREAYETLDRLQSALYDHLPLGLAISRGEWIEEMKEQLDGCDVEEEMKAPPRSRPVEASGEDASST